MNLPISSNHSVHPALYPILAASTLFCAGCSDGPMIDPPTPAVLTAGDLTLAYAENTLTLSRGNTTLLTFPKDAFQLGTVPVALTSVNYDPYRLYVPHPLYDEPEIVWLEPTSITLQSSTETDYTVNLSFPDSSTVVVFHADGPGHISAHWEAPISADEVAYFRLRPRASSTEGFYGLGEYFDDVNSRGHVRAMQIEVDSAIESGYNEAHVPIPFLTGTTGWGLFIPSDRPGVFAVAADPNQPNLIEAAFGTGVASADGLTFHLFGAAHPLDLSRFYYQLTGFPRVPAPWALGPWVWRDENKDQAEFLADANTIRDLDLPTTAMWIDRPYATAVNTFDFLPSQFPNAQALIDEAHSLGFRMALWHTPYLDEKNQTAETADLREYAEAQGYYPITSGLLLNKWGRPIDFTNPQAFAWWQTQLDNYKSMGIEGYKLDYAEDVVPGLTADRNVWEFADGSDERTMHAGYTRLYHQVYSEMLPEDGGFLLCRRGAAGDQQHASVIWPGDLDATFYKHREPFEENGETIVGVGGLPASIVAALTLSSSGYPFFGADTGGYKHSPPNKELFTRWFEQTAFSTVMQIGTSSNTVAWDPNGGPGFDQEMLDWYRLYTRTHLRLYPYLWTHAQLIAQTGRPITRPLGLAYPEMGIHPNDVYLLGDDILVAPITTAGATSRDVPFPPGRWIHFLTGEEFEGDTTVNVSAPLGQIPVFLRAGSVIPMLRPTIDALAPTTQPDRVDSFATTSGILYVKTTRGPASTFTVYDGTVLSAASETNTLTLSVTGGKTFTLGTQFEVIGVPLAPTEIKVDGTLLAEVQNPSDLESAAQGFTFETAQNGTLHIRIPANAKTVEVKFP
ncbi:MAG: glycoside hydrolase family 31 protein [Polyangiaceae bacterium]|nr:glycoside hydrolase family 31 protein [Polyangiaceae bacterium]